MNTQTTIFESESVSVNRGSSRYGLSLYGRRMLGNGFALAVSDGLALAIAFHLAVGVRGLFLGTMDFSLVVLVVIGIWLLGAKIGGLLPAWGLSPVEALRRQVLLIAISFGAALSVLFLSQTVEQYSRLIVVVAFFFALPLLPFLRMQVKGALIRRGMWGVPVAVCGDGEIGKTIIRRLREEPGQGFHPEAVFVDCQVSGEEQFEGIRTWHEADPHAPQLPVAIAALKWFNQRDIHGWLHASISKYRRVLFVPDLVDGPSISVQCTDLNGIPSLEVTHNLLDPARRLLKRFIDLVATLLTFPFWVPLCAFIAFLIWLEDRHHPFFIQKRLGADGKPFRTFKFRTMVPNAEELMRVKLEKDEKFRAAWHSNFKINDDPRITRIGKLLRKLSLDELPQLINVLRGEMSLVGPRPLPAYHYEQLPSSVRALREKVRPGMTGLWQVSGRSDAGNAGMVRWDPYYVRNWSVWLDIVILMRTIRVVLRCKGAY